MRYAIFSDVHNHTKALAAMLHHAETQRVDRYFCLGDVGIDDCVDLVRQIEAPTVFGNWEVSGWRHLSPNNQRWALDLPPLRKTNGFWLTHAAPLWPTHLNTLSTLNSQLRAVPMTRLFPYLHFESEALWQTIAMLNEAEIPIIFHGHTHRQIVWRFTADNHLQKLTHACITIRPGDTLVVGVGSVGRPEDGPSSAYVIFDDDTQQIEMVRLSTMIC